jgi:hypothetical protein
MGMNTTWTSARFPSCEQVRCGVIVDVGLRGVALLLVLLGVVVAMRQAGVVVIMSVPVGAMLPLVKGPAPVVRDVVVAVSVRPGRVGMLRLFS